MLVKYTAILLVLTVALKQVKSDDSFYPTQPMISNFTDSVSKESGRAVYLDCTALLVDPEDQTNLIEWYRLPREDSEDKEPVLMSRGTRLEHQEDRRFGLTVRAFKTERGDTYSMFTLQLEPVMEEDSGSYQCKLTTPSTTETKNVILTVTTS